MDLHGLTVAQAVDKVQERLRVVERDLRSGKLPALTIIVGQGIHSDGHQAKLKPAVLDVLSKQGWAVEMDEPGGQILVRGSGVGARAAAAAQPDAFSQFFDEVAKWFGWCARSSPCGTGGADATFGSCFGGGRE